MMLLLEKELVALDLPMNNNLLSIDQSSRITGYAIFKNAKLIQYGKIVLNEDDLGERLVKLRSSILNLINEFQITEIAFEDIQLQSNITNNVATFKSLAEVFGVIHELVEELNIPYKTILASSWKSTLSIKGRTRTEQKHNAQEKIKELYNIQPTQDECDAICIGIHYLLKPTEQKEESFDWSN